MESNDPLALPQPVPEIQMIFLLLLLLLPLWDPSLSISPEEDTFRQLSGED